MYQPPSCLLSIIVVTVCDNDLRYTIWILGFGISHCPFECIGVLDFCQSDVTKSLDFQKYAIEDPLCPVVWVNDKIADLLEYFLDPFPEFASTLCNNS